MSFDSELGEANEKREGYRRAIEECREETDGAEKAVCGLLTLSE